MSEAIQKFSEDLQALRRRYLSKYHMHPAELVGCLHMEIAVIETGAIEFEKKARAGVLSPPQKSERPVPRPDLEKISGLAGIFSTATHLYYNGESALIPTGAGLLFDREIEIVRRWKK